MFAPALPHITPSPSPAVTSFAGTLVRGARSCFAPRRYTLEVSEERRQWFRVHRCVVAPPPQSRAATAGSGGSRPATAAPPQDPADVPPPGEEHITAAYAGPGTDRVDTVWLRREEGLAIESVLPSTGVRWVRLHMTARWYNSYRLNRLQAFGDRIEAAPPPPPGGRKGGATALSFRDA
jgi:hypothetical protein